MRRLGVAKKKVVLRNISTNEEQQFESSTAAANYLGLKPYHISKSKKLGHKLTSRIDGQQYIAVGEMGMSLNPNGKNNSEFERSHYGGIIAMKNFGSTDDEHPEVIINCSDIQDAIKKTKCSEHYINSHPKFGFMLKDKWYFSKVDTKDVNKLLNAILEDDGIINLDEAEEIW